jgi:hypothetical protein
MKIKQVLLLFLFFVGFSLNAQTLIEKQVKEIENSIKSIEKAALKSKKHPYHNNCGVVDANVSLFYQNNSVVKSTDIGKGDDDKAAANWDYTFYYKNGELIYSKKKSTAFDNEKGKSETSLITEYFHQNKLIKKIENNTSTFPKKDVIGKSDYRFKLQSIKNSKDVLNLFNCTH